MKQSRGERVFAIVNYTALTAFAALALYPFVYTVSMSLSTVPEAARDGLHLYPRDITFIAYRMIFANQELVIGYANTIFRTVVGTILTLLATSMCAYPLSRRYMPHRRLYTLMVLFTMLFSGGIVPGYMLLHGLKLIDTRLVYILPGLITGFNVIILKNFFQQVPESLAESAKVDGASEFSILFRIYMPLSKPALATIGLWTAVFHWNAWLDALIYINSDSKLVMQNFLQRIVIENSTELVEKGAQRLDASMYSSESLKAAAIIVTILPMLALYPFVQRYFVKGILLGGVKE